MLTYWQIDDLTIQFAVKILSLLNKENKNKLWTCKDHGLQGNLINLENKL